MLLNENLMSYPLYFIRHGQTDWNAEARFQGQKDIPLNAKGREQAERNGTVLKNLIDPESFTFISSPLIRTRETMEIVRHTMGLAADLYEKEDRLRELSFGEWEGRTVSDLEVSEKKLWKMRKTDKWHFRSPGGESYADLTIRVRGWFEEINTPLVVVSHGGVNRSLRAITAPFDANALASAIIPQDLIMVIEGNNIRWV